MLSNVPTNALNQERSVIYYTHSKAKLRSVRAVLQRFYRLNWGAWIRPRAGRHKRKWKKTFDLHWWSRQHVFCSKEQCEQLDKMTSAYYKQPKYFIDDPYEPYEKRNNFPFVPLGRKKLSVSYYKTINQYRDE